MDVLGLLERRDKWFLGGGRGTLYAPPFPRFLTAPGFWDECYLADLKLERLFTVLFLDGRGRPMRWAPSVLSWRPDRLIVEHRSADATVRETRCALPCQAWASTFELLSGGTLEAFVWSLQDVREEGYGTPWRSLVDCGLTPESAEMAVETRWPQELAPDRAAVEAEALKPEGGAMMPGVTAHLALGADAPRMGATVNLAQRHDDAPLYELSVLPEQFRDGRLREDFRLQVGADHDGLLHVVQRYQLTPRAPLTVACGAGLSREAAASALRTALATPPAEQSEAAWRGAFVGVPQFESSDPWLTAAYWYRWYGLRLSTVDMPDLPVKRLDERKSCYGPFVTEGIGFFRNFITYSAQAHLREVAWMRSPELGAGILDNLTRVQRPDGSFPGHNYSARAPRDFYHADFATGAEQFDRIHPGCVRGEHVEAFRRYLEYFRSEREATEAEKGGCYGDSPSRIGAYLIFDQNETGQEYMNRYQWVSQDADKWGQFKVAGVDATAYVAMLARFLERRGALPQGFEAPRLYELWDAKAGFFCDRGEKGLSPARPATGFYPLLMPEPPVDEKQARATLERWLLNPDEFWLEKGFPAEAATEPTFCATPEWKEKRTNCPWSGRSWPMANSHLVDALANVARQLAPDLRPKAAEGLQKAVEMLFHDGDPARPCCYEHFNPRTGTPALYRGYDDYMHSWVADLILRHAVGVLPDGAMAGEGATELPGGWALDPLPVGAEIECSGIPHPEGELRVSVKGGKADWKLE